ncbi:MAG: hypothetical protein E3J29_01940 [Dehalococcoidia bacterium]|nr:MAG: hypothetical protein E3J29_01940 [Dehalococcoidia bacterium]
MVLSPVATYPAGGGVTDHGALSGLSDDDHPQYGALAQAETWTALQTFNAGVKLAAGQAIQDSGGTDRYAPSTSSPENVITGDVDIGSGFLAIGNNAAVANTKVINADHIFSLGTFGTGWAGLFNVKDQGSSGTALVVIGLQGWAANDRSGGTDYGVEGLFFSAAHDPSAAAATTTLRGMRVETRINNNLGSVSAVEGIRIYQGSVAGAVAPTDLYGLRLVYSWAGNAPTNVRAIDIPAILAGTNRYAIKVADIAAGTIARILELGPTPYLRLLGSGNWTPAANETPLYLAEGATPTLRQVKQKAGNTLGAGDKVMVLV